MKITLSPSRSFLNILFELPAMKNKMLNVLIFVYFQAEKRFFFNLKSVSVEMRGDCYSVPVGMRGRVCAYI